MNKIEIPQLSYRKFSYRIHNKVIKNRIPLDGSIELTKRCNLSCIHCYYNYEFEEEEEMSFKEISSLLNEISQAGCFWLLITGGEPLLRKDFLDIYKCAKKEG